jgi:ketopantoate hydroxymethyltransferase
VGLLLSIGFITLLLIISSLNMVLWHRISNLVIQLKTTIVHTNASNASKQNVSKCCIYAKMQMPTRRLDTKFSTGSR